MNCTGRFLCGDFTALSVPFWFHSYCQRSRLLSHHLPEPLYFLMSCPSLSYLKRHSPTALSSLLGGTYGACGRGRRRGCLPYLIRPHSSNLHNSLVATKKNTENLRDIEKHQEPRLYYYSEAPISRVLFIPKRIYNFKSSMSIFLFVWEVNIRQGGMA